MEQKIDEKFYQEFEEILLREKEHAQKIIDEIDNLQKKKIKKKKGSENSASTTEEESGYDVLEQEVYFLDKQLEKIKKINIALKRIYDKTYGVCEMCGCEIQRERLLIVPYSRHCIDCKSKIESKPRKRK